MINGVNNKDQYGYTPLMLAVHDNDQAAVKSFLSQKDIDLSVKDNDGNTALMIAAYLGHISIVKTLLENGAQHKLSFFDHYFYTPSVYSILKSYASEEELAQDSLFTMLVYIMAFSVVGIIVILFIPRVPLFIEFGLVVGLGLYVADLTLRMFAQFHATEHSVNNDMQGVNSDFLKTGAPSFGDVLDMQSDNTTFNQDGERHHQSNSI